MGILILIFIIGHLLADYPLQTNKINRIKKNWKGLITHVSIHFLINLLLTIIFVIWTKQEIGIYKQLIVCLLVIGITHYIVDYLKEKLTIQIDRKLKDYNNSIAKAILYIIDQIIHLLSIIFIVQITFNENYNIFSKFISLVTLEKNFELNLSTQIFLTMIIVLLNIYFVGYLIGIILKPFKPNNFITETTTTIELPFKIDEKRDRLDGIKEQQKIIFINDSPPKAGMWIGILERTIILILCIIGNVSGIGFLIAMKALTRFKQFEDKTFAEYYLIGSMLSIVFAIINGYLVKIMW